MSSFPRKILISLGYGAGWATWNSSEFKQFMAEYKPIIDYIEENGKPPAQEDPVVLSMVAEIKELTGDEDQYVCLHGLL